MIISSVSGNDPSSVGYLRRLRMQPPRGQLAQFTALSFANLFAAATSFISLAVVARSLPVAEFAQLVFALSATAAAFSLLDPRFEDSLVRFIPIVHRDRDAAAASRLFERALLLDQVLNCVFGALGVIVLLSGMVPGSVIADPALLVPATVYMAAQGPVGTMAAGYALTDGLTRWGMLQSASTLVITVASLVGLALGGAVGFLVASAIAAGLTTAALWYASVRRTRRFYGFPSRVRQSLPKGFVSFTLRAAANSSISIGAEALPLTIVGLRADAKTLALFRVALSPGRLANALVSPVASIIYPRASRASAAGRPASAAAEALDFSRRVTPISGVLFCIAAIAMPTAITLAFGSTFRDASATATVLLAAALLRGIVAWAKTLPLAFGDATRRLAVSLLDVVGLVTAATLLAETPHAIGVAIAYIAIALAVSAYWLIYAYRKSARTSVRSSTR